MARKKTTTSTKTKSKTAKKASKEIMYTDGKSVVANEKDNLKDLEKILNPSLLTNHFKAQTEEEFDSKIADMTMPDLQSLAVRVGVFPSGNRTTLKNKLKKEFKSVVFAGKGRVMASEKPIMDINSLSEDQKKLFREI